MKTSNRIFLVILITGLTALSILSITVYSINRSMVVKSNLKRSEIQAKELSYHLNRLLSEKINMVMMMATSRVILEALDMSNLSYAQIPDEKRDGLIKRQNSKWLSVNDPTDRFILKYTDNKVSGLLKAKQRTVEGEFGEIFLTNKFGALVASTSKLSTFAHGHKYWWLGAYGKGAVFIDDRGYDNSVGGYVLGLVIPIKKDGQISGLLKCNLNIMHSLRELIINTNCDPYSDFRLVRSGGLILFAQGVEPLKRRVNDAVALRLKKGDIKPFILRNSEGKYLVGLSEVELTKKNGKKYEFGGTFESADHKQGNRSESWFVLHYKSMSSIDSMLARAYKLVGFIGITLVIFLGLVSFWFSRKITGSLYALNMATEQIGMGNFEYRIPEQKNDEFGNLASSFNIMSSRLKETTTKVSTLNNEIVQRRRAEKELKGQRDLFELVINSVPARIFWKNLDLVYLGCNTNFAKDSGMETIANVIGRDDYDLVWKDDAEIYRADDRGVINTGRPKLNYEEPFVNKEGKEVCWLTRKMPLKNDDGEIIGVIAISENITEQKKAEEERQRLEMQLQQLKKMESIGQLAGGIAHDFNNILYPIIGFTQLSQNELPREHPVQENLQDILDGAIRASDLVKRILLFSRQKEHQLESVTLQPVIKESYKLLRSSIPVNIDIELDLYDGEDAVMCDATEIHEIVLNLCTNAYHAITGNKGRIIISLRKENPSQGVDLSSEKYLRLSVMDNGAGIPEEIMGSIFEPYMTTKEIGKGSGLGLSVVYGIVESYNGIIDVKTDSSRGTEIIIFFPVSKKSPGENRLIGEEAFNKRGHERILLVDDEESIIKICTRALEGLGYDVVSTLNSHEALELFRSSPDDFDLVITDMAMPGMVGSELAEEILKIRPDAKVIICSGYSEKLEKEKIRGLRVSAFIDKPLSVHVLAKITRKLLDKPDN